MSENTSQQAFDGAPIVVSDDEMEETWSVFNLSTILAKKYYLKVEKLHFSATCPFCWSKFTATEMVRLFTII
jgi:hypothetical protein